jgi:hypothetical protein
VTTSLSGRVRALERQRHHAAGCSRCGGWGFHILEPDEDVSSWLDASSCCRGCGQGVKLIDRGMWDLL